MSQTHCSRSVRRARPYNRCEGAGQPDAWSTSQGRETRMSVKLNRGRGPAVLGEVRIGSVEEEDQGQGKLNRS